MRSGRHVAAAAGGLVASIVLLMVAPMGSGAATPTTAPLQFGAVTTESCSDTSLDLTNSANILFEDQLEDNIPFASTNGVPFIALLQGLPGTLLGPNCGTTTQGSSASIGPLASASTTFANSTAGAVLTMNESNSAGVALPALPALGTYNLGQWAESGGQQYTVAEVDPTLAAGTETMTVTVKFAAVMTSTAPYQADVEIGIGDLGSQVPTCGSNAISADYSSNDQEFYTTSGSYTDSVTFTCPAGESMVLSAQTMTATVDEDGDALAKGGGPNQSSEISLTVDGGSVTTTS
ncbi:MAG TPA: hypothetical protein VGG38_20880 [Acidimicrobiales bacterium]